MQQTVTPSPTTKPEVKKVHGFRLSSATAAEIYRLAAFYPKPGGSRGPSEVRVIEEAVALLSKRHPKERVKPGIVAPEVKETFAAIAAKPQPPKPVEPGVPHFGKATLPALSGARKGMGSAILKPGGKVL